MNRGIGGIEPVQELIPEMLAPFVGLVTQLGDIWFVTLLLAVVYVRCERDRAATAVGLAIGAVALVYALKYAFALPRPDRPLADPAALPWLLGILYEATGTAGGYGFPSGHALKTTVIYPLVAGLLAVGSRRQRYAAAAALVAAISLSRVALGVHYVVDVVAGVLIGLAFLAAARRLLERTPGDRASTALAIGVALAGVTVVVSGRVHRSIQILGVALGAFGGWQLVVLGRRLVRATRPSALLRPAVLRGGPALAALAPLWIAADEFALASTAASVGFAGLGVTALFALPALADSPHAERAWAAAAFWAGAARATLTAPHTRRLLDRGAFWAGGVRTVLAARETRLAVRDVVVAGVAAGARWLRTRGAFWAGAARTVLTAREAWLSLWVVGKRGVALAARRSGRSTI